MIIEHYKFTHAFALNSTSVSIVLSTYHPSILEKSVGIWSNSFSANAKGDEN